MQQWHECRSKNKEPHNLAITSNHRVALQHHFTNWERSCNDLTKKQNATTAVEHYINGVVSVAIRTKTKRW